MADNDPLESVVVNPRFDPYTTGDFVWIRIASHKVEHFTSWGRDKTGGVRVNDEEEFTWSFLAPEQILETVNHMWEPWETIASRLAGKGKEYTQLKNDISGIVEAVMSGKKGIEVDRMFNNITSIEKEKWKIDTPLVYEGSERREYTLEFQLTAKTSEDADEMMFGVRELQVQSSPSRAGNVSIDLPCIFSVKNYPYTGGSAAGVMIDLPYAAITSIQPTYMAPYDDRGLPMRISLTVTFKELPPLYSDSFESF